MAEHKAELIKNRKKKKRKFKNSFFYADNLISWTKDELENQDPVNSFNETLIQIYEDKDKKS